MKRTNTLRSSIRVILLPGVVIMLAMVWGGGALGQECLTGDTDCDDVRCTADDVQGVIDQALGNGTCEGDVTCDGNVDLFDVLCTVDCSLNSGFCQPCTGGGLLAICEDCRALFFAREIATADDCFANELATNPNDHEARLFHALTSTLRVAEDDNPLPYAGSFQHLLDRFGFPAAGRSIFDFYAQAPATLPTDSPRGAEIQTFFRDVLLPAIRAAITDVGAIDETFVDYWTGTELSAFGWTDAQTVEIDYGDVKVLEAALQGLRGMVAWWLTAYDLDVDIDYLDSATNIDGIQDVLDLYPTLLGLTAQGPTQLAEARDGLMKAIEEYYAASRFIREEVDLQTDDLVSIPPEDLAGEEQTRMNLGQVWCSLQGMSYLQLDPGTGSALCTPGTPMIAGESVNLERLFTPAFGLREKFPAFTADAQCGTEYADCSNPTPTSPFPDPTLNGALPQMTQEALCEIMGLNEFLCREGYFWAAVTSPGTSVSAGWTYLRSCDGLNEAPVVNNIYLQSGNAFRISYWDGQQEVDQISLPVRLCQGPQGISANVHFEPQQTGTFHDLFVVESNDPTTPVMTIGVTGCTDYPCCPVSALLGTWYYCEDCDKTGLKPLSWVEFQSDGDLVITLPTTENCLPQSGCTANVSYGSWSLNNCTVSIDITTVHEQDGTACSAETGISQHIIDYYTNDTLILRDLPFTFKRSPEDLTCN